MVDQNTKLNFIQRIRQQASSKNQQHFVIVQVGLTLLFTAQLSVDTGWDSHTVFNDCEPLWLKSGYLP